MIDNCVVWYSPTADTYTGYVDNDTNAIKYSNVINELTKWLVKTMDFGLTASLWSYAMQWWRRRLFVVAAAVDDEVDDDDDDDDRRMALLQL